MFYSNYGSISCCFWDIQCRKILQPWNRSQGSIKVIESDTIRQTGYGFVLVFYSNFVLRCTVLEIFDFKNAVTLKPGLGSLKVIGTNTDRSITYNFLLTLHSNHGPISYCFRDKRQFQSKITSFPHPCVFNAAAERVPLGIGYRRWGVKKLECWSYQAEEEVWRSIFSRLYTIHQCKIDGQTDRRTPGDSKDCTYM